MTLFLRHLYPPGACWWLIVAVWCLSCHQDQLSIDQGAPQSYAFFIAGHTYGRAGVNNDGLHPPFRKKFDLITSDSTIRFGVLTGDIVRYCTHKDWDEVDRDLALLDMPVYFAAGNHDVENRPLYEARYGRTWYKFEYQQDLFIILDPNLDRWNISGTQLQWLQEVLEQSDHDRIFVLFHHLLWWTPDNAYRKERPNSFQDRDDDPNFWSELEPLFRQQDASVFLIAGDIGVRPDGTGYFYDRYANLTLIASGMGNRPTDNFVVIDVPASGAPGYRLIALDGDDIHALGRLEDYRID